MSYYATANSIDAKLAELLADHNMVHEFKTASHPIALVVSPDASPEAQMEMYATADSSVSSYDARLRLIFGLDGNIEIQTDNRFVVSDALMGKIKNLGKKYRDAFTYAFFANHCNDRLLVSATEKDAEPAEEDGEAVGSFDGFFDDNSEE